MSQTENPKYPDVHPDVIKWVEGADPDDLQSVQDWTAEPWPVTSWEDPNLYMGAGREAAPWHRWPNALFELYAHPHDCGCPYCSGDGDDFTDDETQVKEKETGDPDPEGTDGPDLEQEYSDPAEGWMADSWAGQFDDDPSPYDGNYSEE